MYSTDRQVNLRAVERRIKERSPSTGDVESKKWNSIVKDIRKAEDKWMREIAELSANRAEAHLSNRHRHALVGSSVLISATLYVRQEQRNSEHTFSESLCSYSKGLHAMTKRFEQKDAEYMQSHGKAHLLKAEAHAEMTKKIYRVRKDARDRSWADEIVWAPECRQTHSDPEWQIRQACDHFKLAEESLCPPLPKEEEEAAQSQSQAQSSASISVMMQQQQQQGDDYDLKDLKDLSDLNRLRCKFADFCRESLTHARDPSILANTMVRQLLQAMANGSKAARMSFPSVLTVLAAHPSTLETFAKYAADVPIWMFLTWCRQIISRINTVRPESDVLIQLLIRLATEYPQTVYYPFQLSFSDFDKDAQRKTEPLKHALQTAASCDLHTLSKFIRAIGLLTDPWSRKNCAINQSNHNERTQAKPSQATINSNL